MNRVWNLWCSLSGTDPNDARLKIAFNVDTRIASLSGHSVELVEGLALELWRTSPGRAQHEFVDLWLSAVTDAQGRLDDEIERERRQRAEEEACRRQAEETELQRRLEDAAREQRTEEAERVRLEVRTAALVRSRIPYLYNITSVGNVESIAKEGILCHDRAALLQHDDLSDSGVQKLRGLRTVSDGKPLHQFASLYINPRNAMLFRLVREGRALVVLRVSPEVLDQPGVVMTDGNAASGGSGDWLGTRGLARIVLDRVYSREWTVDGTVDEDLKRTMQAEVLVPHEVQPRFILGFLAPSASIYEQTMRAAPRWSGKVDPDLFFGSWPLDG